MLSQHLLCPSLPLHLYCVSDYCKARYEYVSSLLKILHWLRTAFGVKLKLPGMD